MRRRAILLAPLTACARRSATTQIRIALPAASIAHLPLTLAHSLGFFAEEGLDVRMEELKGAGKVTEAVVGGSSDVGGGSYQQTVQANAAGAGIQCCSVLCTQYTHILAAAPGRTSPRRVADLKGKTAGVMNHGDSTQNVLHYLLLRHGMTPAEVTTVAVGTGATAIAALENGRVAAAMLVSAPFEVLRLRHPEVAVLLDLRRSEDAIALFGQPEVPGASVFSTPQWLGGNPDAARRICRAMGRAARWIRERPAAEAESKLPESLRALDAKAVREALRVSQPSFSMDGRMPVHGPEAIVKLLHAVVDPSLNIDLAKAYTNEFLEAKP